MYELRFWFEHGGGCLWSASAEAKETYGYKVNYDHLPIGGLLKSKLSLLEEEYATYLDWDNPAAGCQWSRERKAVFLENAQRVYDELCTELGPEYTVFDETLESV